MSKKFTFGKYEGMKFSTVAEEDPNYIVWLYDNLGPKKLKEKGIYEEVKDKYESYTPEELEEFGKPKKTKKGSKKDETDEEEDGEKKTKPKKKPSKKTLELEEKIKELEERIKKLEEILLKNK